jgi:DNA topoisomerase IB
MSGRSESHDHGEDDAAHQAVTSAVQMEERMDEPSQSVRTYLDRVTPERRRDAEKLLELMARVTGRYIRSAGSRRTRDAAR